MLRVNVSIPELSEIDAIWQGEAIGCGAGLTDESIKNYTEDERAAIAR